MARKCTDCGEMTLRMGINEPDDYKVLCEVCSRKCIKCGKVQIYADGNKVCSDCFNVNKSKSKHVFGIIDKTKYGKTKMSESHFKDLNSRVVDDSGKTLMGKEGLRYMESKGNTYSSRLKAYYK